jgi:hypothetical protein
MNHEPATSDFFPNQQPETSDQEPITCLGMTFENNEKRREYFLEKLREKLKDPEFRRIDGFPIGSDEDILAMSDPPYYTACPNPFLGYFIKHYGRPYDPDVPYNRKPFAVDVSEGKTDSIYKAHGYHTKVPHLAIVPSILHYTEPGDIVLDGFCGSGMTGVAPSGAGRLQKNSGVSLKQCGSMKDSASPHGAYAALCNATFHQRQHSLLPITTYRSTWMPSCG